MEICQGSSLHRWGGVVAHKRILKGGARGKRRVETFGRPDSDTNVKMGSIERGENAGGPHQFFYWEGGELPLVARRKRESWGKRKIIYSKKMREKNREGNQRGRHTALVREENDLTGRPRYQKEKGKKKGQLRPWGG